MKTIKNSKELAKLVNEYNDLILPNEDVRIEFEPTSKEIRNIECNDLFLMNDKQKFDFNGRDFNGVDFNGRDFNGRDFNGVDFNGRDFNGWNFNGWNFNGRDFNGRDFNGGNFNGGDFNGRDFNGRKVSYYAFFNCYGSMKCKSWEARREVYNDPVCLGGEIEIINPPKDTATEEAIALLKENGYKIVKE